MIWLLTRWPVYQYEKRVITDADLKKAESLIARVPTGKQRCYRHALNDVLFYLQEACQWHLPERSQPSIRDTEYDWFESMARQSNNAGRVFTAYQDEKDRFIAERGEISPVLISLMIGCEVAPLSLRHISQILSDPTSITQTKTRPRLRIYHQTHNKEEPRYTHYHLSLFSFRLLSDFYDQHSGILSEKALHKQLITWAQEKAIPSGRQTDWQRRFQLAWYVRHKLPPALIKDLSIPERHVGLPDEYQNSSLSRSDIYAIDWDLNWFEQLSTTTQKTHWPHRALLKAKTSTRQDLRFPDWEASNILPKMLYHYTEQLITFGGVKKSDLATSSIEKYTYLESLLASYPLPYANATNEEAINIWAQSLYGSLTTDYNRQMIYYFLKFLSVQELTEALDITELFSPTTPPAVSAACINLSQLDELITTLIEANHTHPFRSLFASIAALLGFFGMLRRGEVLRLRCKDIAFEPKSGRLTLHITSTEEGQTKNGQSRMVYTTIPHCYRKLFQVILKVKEDAPPTAPLLGFNQEKYHSRQLYYLLPVSRALKVLFGKHVNFHHLRHSGVYVLMLQALHMISHTPERYRGNTALEQEVMSSVSIATRFDYWLEGRDIREVNDGILLDEVCKQIGHAHYATTRWSYLHDIDWLLPIVCPAYTEYTPRAYSHAELRYLFGLSAHSNDLSRRLSKLLPHYDVMSLNEKRRQPIVLTDHELRGEIFNRQPQVEEALERDHYMTWQQSIHASQDTLLSALFHAMLVNQSLDLHALSQVWGMGCQHHITPVDKKQKTALRNLPAVEFGANHNTLRMTLACNRKNAHAFKAAFRHKVWEWLEFRFELSINRKLNHERQMDLLMTYFVNGNEAVDIRRHPTGQTTLTIIFQSKQALPSQVLEYTHQFIASLQSNEETV
jgi:integrase